MKLLIVVMGVSGSGKSTVGKALAEELNVPYLEADDYHPVANVEKMSNAVPLTDQDRWPWLEALSLSMVKAASDNGGAVTSCSALKRCYREYILKQAQQPVLFAFLDGDREIIESRMSARKDHYMPTSLLDSQFADLEKPDKDEPALRLSIDKSVAELVSEIASSVNTYQQ